MWGARAGRQSWAAELGSGRGGFVTCSAGRRAQIMWSGWRLTYDVGRPPAGRWSLGGRCGQPLTILSDDNASLNERCVYWWLQSGQMPLVYTSSSTLTACAVSSCASSTSGNLQSVAVALLSRIVKQVFFDYILPEKRIVFLIDHTTWSFNPSRWVSWRLILCIKNTHRLLPQVLYFLLTIFTLQFCAFSQVLLRL